MEQAVGVIKSEQQRSDNLAAGLKFFPIAESADDAVRASVPLYLLHAVAVAGLIWEVEAFRNHAVASTTCRSKPTLSILQLQAGRRKTEQVCARKVPGGEILELQAPLGQRLAGKRNFAFLQQVERKKQSRRFHGQFFYTADGWMNTLQKVVEGKLPADRNDNFAIKDKARFAKRSCGSNDLRKIAGQILT